MHAKVAILGAGSWGTAVAIHLAHCSNEVLLWAHDAGHVAEMQREQANLKYLSSAPFPKGLSVHADLNFCVTYADYVFMACPSHAFSEVLAKIEVPLKGLVWLTKGLDPATHRLLSALVEERFGAHFPMAMVSGPSFAKEVAAFLPTALSLAGNDADFLKSLQKLLHQKNMRVYLSKDLIGMQVCAAVKNVLAIATGVSDGLGYGANARAAIITRGLAEMARLGRAFGAKEATFIGLAGVGDLLLTCTDNQSRNRRFGLKLAEGLSVQAAEASIGQVVEGKYNAAQVGFLAKQHQVEMPICAQVEALVLGKTTPQKACQSLMTRMAAEEGS